MRAHSDSLSLEIYHMVLAAGVLPNTVVSYNNIIPRIKALSQWLPDIGSYILRFEFNASTYP